MKIDTMKIMEIIGKAASGIGHFLRTIADGIDPSDNLMKVTNPCTRQSFSENVRNYNSRR